MPMETSAPTGGSGPWETPGPQDALPCLSQDGHRRPLHERATIFSMPHSGQRSRANPPLSIPQARYFSNSRWTNAGHPLLSSKRLRPSDRKVCRFSLTTMCRAVFSGSRRRYPRGNGRSAIPGVHSKAMCGMVATGRTRTRGGGGGRQQTSGQLGSTTPHIAAIRGMFPVGVHGGGRSSGWGGIVEP